MSTGKKKEKSQNNGKLEKNKMVGKSNKITEPTKDAIERNKYVLDLVNSWISNADNKIEMAFAILSAILALGVFVTEDLLSGIKTTTVNTCLMCWFHLLVIVSGLLFLASVWFYIQCIIPRFTKDNLMNKRYSIFYDEIKNYKSYKEYIDVCKNANDEMFNEEIVKEIYFNSCICSKKMRNFRRGIILSGLSIASSVVTAFVYYLAVI